jgi:inosine-uridine nucleoside N-ribohydrolase
MPRQPETTQCHPPNEHQAAAFARGTDQPVPIIFDTDFSPDVDDVGALAILHAFADQGEAEILGVVISSGDTYAARAVDTVNTYYGRPNIPIGITWNPTVATDSPYTRALALDFPNNLQEEITPVAPNAMKVYRQLLAAQPERSVTIVSVGFLNNLRDLLDSAPDDISELPGLELVKTKVARVVMMGGHYPDSASHPAGAEYNFVMDAESACVVIREWPTPIIFSGFELGVDIINGATLQAQTPSDNPVCVAYKLYTGGVGRSSWDLVTVHYAVRGSAGGYQLCAGGSNEVTRDGKNRWSTSVTTRPHAYLINTMPKEKIENVIEDLLVQPPQRAPGKTI